ncbi:hypothetical protein HUK65_06420 [Rhodobacteraceae bacterium 2376]|uniref:Uncharacterized protein n=1 Tax=Rhabdonatronobacter sediminivivens TaxID=2743469 RepID=A0A7Z0KX75_9RHOB|nr:hypothetical protein [Rhabdonatronobacter sediminivivens]NYS24622.1 hypothetical protein [Rhabdonatronobacter sediminivivens]
MPRKAKAIALNTPADRWKQAGAAALPIAGLAVMALSASALAALASAFPEAAAQCDPRGVDFGCGHGFGCACHMLPADGPKLD